MIVRLVIISVLLCSFTFGQGCAVESVSAAEQADNKKQVENNPVDDILARLTERGKTLSSYQCKLDHLVEQPLFESQSLRKGEMFYYRDKKQSLLRIDFNTLKQDDEPEVDDIDQYIFDGVWLTRIQHNLKEIKKYQLVDVNEIHPDKGVDAFDLISQHLPIVGLTGADRLKGQFDIALAEPNDNEPNYVTKLHMEVKPDSVYKDEWLWINFWIDDRVDMPIKMVTMTTEEDIYSVEFVEPKINELDDLDVFNVKVPKGFNVAEVVPYKRGNK